MPQLDVVIFLMEYLWLVFFLFVIYNLMNLIFFPGISIFMYVYKYFNNLLQKERVFMFGVTKKSYLVFNMVILKKEYIIDVYSIWCSINENFFNYIKNSYFLYNCYYVVNISLDWKKDFFSDNKLLKGLCLFFNLIRINGRI